jgi:hypothetical protein
VRLSELHHNLTTSNKGAGRSPRLFAQDSHGKKVTESHAHCKSQVSVQ